MEGLIVRPLHKAMFNPVIRVPLVKLLVENGADVNIPNTKAGETALHYAVRLGRRDLIKILLLAGADVNVREKRGLTAADVAGECQQEELQSTLKAAMGRKFPSLVVKMLQI